MPLSGKRCVSWNPVWQRNAGTPRSQAASRAINRRGPNCSRVLERLNKSIAEIVALGPDLRRRAERDVVQFALLVAKRVLHRQLAVDEGALTALARVTFERLTRSESYTITVNPRFAAAITSALPGSHASRVKIQPDPECAPGTLIIHSAEGIIDASVDTQLEEIGRGLADRLAGG